MGASTEIIGKKSWYDEEQELKREMRKAKVEAGEEHQAETPVHDVSKDAFEMASAATLQKILEEAVESQKKYAAMQDRLEQELARRRGDVEVPTFDLSQELGDMGADGAANTDAQRPDADRAA
ncbi:MAG: hypothetical protein Q7T01_00360 [bacterium]|nr:hypothetical protein [bacterium]